VARNECDWIAPPGGFPVRNVPSSDGKSILVEPLVPLRVGRRYALVVEGLPEPALAALRKTVVPVPAAPAKGPEAAPAGGAARPPGGAATGPAPRDTGGGAIVLPPGSFADLVDSRAGQAKGIDRERWTSLLRRLENESAMPGLPAFSGAR